MVTAMRSLSAKLSVVLSMGSCAALAAACSSGTTAWDGAPPVASAAASPKAPATTSAPTTKTGTTGAPTSGAPASPSCAGKAAQPLDAVWTVQSGGVPRVFEVHVPASYAPSAETPVVLNFHGFTSDGVEEEVLSNMNAKADTAGFVAVYPEGLGAPQSWNAGACCGYAEEANVDDVAFVGALLDELESKLCVDARRVFVTGMSNGGFLAHRLGCELASRVAAIAPVAGVIGVTTCAPSRPVPVMEFDGTLDTLVPYDGDPALGFPSVAATIAGWVARDSCTGSPVQTYSDRDSQCESYESCAGGAEVTLCTIQGGGHTWPGGTPVPALGYTTPYLSATDAMWTFFQAHPMP
jgi:polyhydroxybutyrate depolymerase